MAFLTESFDPSKYTPLYKNEQNKREKYNGDYSCLDQIPFLPVLAIIRER